MPSFRNALLASSLLFLLTVSLPAQEPIRFARTPDVSPDGKLVTFSYLGDIWVVEAIGGVARPVTMHAAHEIYPVFSPDGRQIAFSSNRHGSYDVYVVSTQGGKPTRLTFDSAADFVTGWSPDGKNVLFTSGRSIDFPPTLELYSVPVDGGREQRITVHEGREGVYSPRGDQIAYVRGPGTWYRKGYRGSSKDDVWICNADGSNNRQLTKSNVQDNSPMWSADGQFIYYVSEFFGTPANIVRQDMLGKNPPQQVTFHKEDAVRRARISGNGQWIVYECGADLYVTSANGASPPRKLAIEVHADDKTNPDVTLTLTQGASEYALSSDEKHVTLVVHGQIFLMPMQTGGKATRLTHSAAYDHGVAWAPDGSKLIFASDRNGHENFYLLESAEAGKKLYETTRFKEPKQLTDALDAEYGASFAPDGKRVAFVRAGKLYTMNPDGSDQKVIVDKTQVIDYEWSPDSKWLAFARLDGSLGCEIYILPAGGGEARNVTRYATFNAGITWSGRGMKLAFLSERRNASGIYVMSLQKPTTPDAPPSDDIDWEDIHQRVEQAAPISAEQGAISFDGSRVAFRSAGGNNGQDLWIASTNGSQLSRITTGNQRPTQIQWSHRLLTSELVYFLDGNGVLRAATVSGSVASVPFKIKMTISRDAEFAEMFEQSWRSLAEHFYDPKFHGADWAALRLKYRPLVKHCALKEDLYALISLMMGELNASHLGISGYRTTPEEMTGHLGFVFDDTYRGPGLKIAEVLKQGPADKRGLNIKAGDIIVAIDGTELNERVNLSQLLNDKVGENVALQLVAAGADLKDPKVRRKVETQAVNQETIANLMYERWVRHNAERVNELSNGKLGYIHIPSMDEAGLDRFVRALYSDNFDKEAIVLDVRFNGGGFTHDRVLNYLGGREHTLFRQRDGGEGWVLRADDRKWSKPLVLLINNHSYSDAEILPNAFRTLGLGKLVGQPTGGCVIGTSGIRLIDGSVFRVPRTGVFTLKGVDMEKEGVPPDVLVENHPDQLAKGVDAQLDRAVAVLQQDVAAWKKSHSNVVVKPEEAGKGAEQPQGVAPGK